MKSSHLFFIILAVFIANISTVQGLKFTLEILGLERVCFYEVLSQSQKYTLQLQPKNQPKYQVEVSQSEGGVWKNMYYKMTSVPYQKIQIHKLATFSSTYSVCIKNIQRQQLTISVKFISGIQLMQFELLPDNTDAENLDRQIAWVQNEKKNLYDTIRKIQQHKFNNTNSSSLLSKKMILFAIIGLISIVIVNFLFFSQIKKTFKERKLI